MRATPPRPSLLALATDPILLSKASSDIELAEHFAGETLPHRIPLYVAQATPQPDRRHSSSGSELTGSERADALFEEVASEVQLGSESVLEWPQFRRALDAALLSAATEGADVGLILVEIDYFDLIAGHYGSREGERLMRELLGLCQAGRFVDGLLGLRRAGACAVRISSASYDRVRRVAGRVLTLVRTEMTFGDDCRSSVSIGCALSSEVSTPSATALIELAEQRTREAQAAGGNRLLTSGWFR